MNTISDVMIGTHRGLDHVVSAVSHVTHEIEYVQDTFSLDLFHDVVYGDECASSPHAGTVCVCVCMCVQEVREPVVYIGLQSKHALVEKAPSAVYHQKVITFGLC